MTNDSEKKNEGSACGCGTGSCGSGPGKWIWIALVLAVAGIMIAKNDGKCGSSGTCTIDPTVPAPAPVSAPSGDIKPAMAESVKTLPLLVDLGANKCIPCKMMAPILEDLKTTYAGKLDVEFIDVWQDTEAGRKYGIRVIPTQIFFDAAGKELFRHEGFFAKEDILKTWKQYGVNLEN
jgi:thioredoxin 1